TAAEVDEALARLESQLSANVIKLALLGLVDAFAFVSEIAAGVLHVTIQKEREELAGRAVVMVLNSLAVAVRRTFASLQLGALPADAWPRLVRHGQQLPK